MPVQRSLNIIKHSVIVLIASSVLILWTPLSIAKLTYPLTTDEIIKQAETLFGGMALSVQQGDEDHHYQVRLLKASGKVIYIRVNSLSGQMTEEKQTVRQ
ncbi:MAG: hypothetical protein V7459_03575 [Oceanicoccus sp.]